jgi:hypothetical protein
MGSAIIMVKEASNRSLLMEVSLEVVLAEA